MIIYCDQSGGGYIRLYQYYCFVKDNVPYIYKAIYLQGSPNSSISWSNSTKIINVLTNQILYTAGDVGESSCISGIASRHGMSTSDIQKLNPEQLLEWIINNVITLDKPIYKDGDI